MMRVLSGVRPTGKLHLGHWVGVLSKWIELQKKYECLFMIADRHALMSEYRTSFLIKDNIIDNVSDWLAWGVNPEKSIIFVQSQVPLHLELFSLLSLLTPLGWLFRCPTFKEQIRELKDKEINTYAFLGYPVLQAADILIYKANFVPVGEDQLPHLEITREIVRRFHFIYKKNIFIEPQPILTTGSRLLGLDKRKMSKSYNNFITLDEEEDSIEAKVISMFTDPLRIKKEDKGHPDECNVFSYYNIFKKEMRDEVYDWCINAKRGCKECKKNLAQIIKELIVPKREKKREILKDRELIYSILEEGKKKAEKIATQTWEEVREVVGLL